MKMRTSQGALEPAARRGWAYVAPGLDDAAVLVAWRPESLPAVSLAGALEPAGRMKLEFRAVAPRVALWPVRACTGRDRSCGHCLDVTD